MSRQAEKKSCHAKHDLAASAIKRRLLHFSDRECRDGSALCARKRNCTGQAVQARPRRGIDRAASWISAAGEILAKDLEFNSKQDLERTAGIELILVEPKELIRMVKEGEIWVADSVFAITIAMLNYGYLFE